MNYCEVCDEENDFKNFQSFTSDPTDERGCENCNYNCHNNSDYCVGCGSPICRSHRSNCND